MARTPQETATILIAHSMPLLAAGLASLLRKEVGWHVVTDPKNLVAGPVDVVVADQPGAIALSSRFGQLPENLDGSRLLLVSHDRWKDRIPTELVAWIATFTTPCCTVDVLTARARMLATGWKGHSSEGMHVLLGKIACSASERVRSRADALQRLVCEEEMEMHHDLVDPPPSNRTYSLINGDSR